MGLRKMIAELPLILGFGFWKGYRIVKAQPSLCPNEHDMESMERLLAKSKVWKTSKWVAQKGSQLIGQPGPEGLDELILAEALMQHDKECVRGPMEKWCRCKYCNHRREMLLSQQ